MEQDILRIMSALGVDRETATEIAQADKAIDRGEPMPFDLTAEQEKVTRTYRQVARPVMVESKPRPRKTDEDKREIISTLDDALCDLVDNVIVTNPERQLDFEYNGRKFRLTLSAPRS